MQIGGASTYFPHTPSPQAARPLSSDVSPDLRRADQAPPTPGQALSDEQSSSPREEADKPAGTAEDAARSGYRASRERRLEQLEQLEVAKLVSRDQEVRTHEQAHASVGGTYAGAPTYTFTRGPDGKRYAVGGEVSIDVSPVPNDPQATLRKMEVVLRAALAPAEPSAQDRRVAAEAQAQMAAARAELMAAQRSEASAEDEKTAEEKAEEEAAQEPEQTERQTASPAPNLELYRLIGDQQGAKSQVNLLA
ncbi:MAG: putative metalloprotease CJM1_0395 family protein [Pseudomonas sp.]|uniref:putative metalloprotease CJM1_0395 family protein n=1 Tax=Pseudomonas sp. TaxID=306 RepID=UPI003D0A1E9D